MAPGRSLLHSSCINRHKGVKEMKKNMTNGTIEFSDTDMYYVSFGSGKRNLVVLPGLSDGLATVKGKAWLLHFPYRRYLKDYKVYIFSRKNKMPENYTIRQMADDQVLAMKKLGLNKANILGVSQGGMIAQYIAINHPETVDKLILAVTAPSGSYCTLCKQCCPQSGKAMDQDVKERRSQGTHGRYSGKDVFQKISQAKQEILSDPGNVYKTCRL